MSTSFVVHARFYWNNTTYSLVRGRRYRLTASGFWYDAWIKCGPDGYSSPNSLMARFEQYRRAPQQNWFALIGAVDQDESSHFKIGGGITFTADRSGLLACFANDVPGFYWNNWGSLQLSLTEL